MRFEAVRFEVVRGFADFDVAFGVVLGFADFDVALGRFGVDVGARLALLLRADAGFAMRVATPMIRVANRLPAGRSGSYPVRNPIGM